MTPDQRAAALKYARDMHIANATKPAKPVKKVASEAKPVKSDAKEPAKK